MPAPERAQPLHPLNGADKRSGSGRLPSAGKRTMTVPTPISPGSGYFNMSSGLQYGSQDLILSRSPPLWWGKDQRMTPASPAGGGACRNCQFQRQSFFSDLWIEMSLVWGSFPLLSPLILLIEIASINPAPFDVFLPNLHGGLLQ